MKHGVTTLFVLLIIALHTSCGFLGWDKLTQTLQPTGLCKISLYYDLFALERGCISIVSLSTHQGVHDYGIDWDGPITMDEDNTVTVPDLPLYVISEQHISKHTLREELPRHPDDIYGVEHYVLTKALRFRKSLPLTIALW